MSRRAVHLHNAKQKETAIMARTTPKELSDAQDKIKTIHGGDKTPVDYAKFRRALNLARGNEHKISKFKGKSVDIEFILVDKNGVESPFLIAVHFKRLYQGDYERYNDQQFQWEDNDGKDLKEPKRVMSRYVSGVLVGCADADGNLMFDEKDVDMLESPLNITNVMRLYGRIIQIAGLTESAEVLEKSE